MGSVNVAIFMGTLVLLCSLVFVIPLFIVLKYKPEIRATPRDTIIPLKFISIILVTLIFYCALYTSGITFFVYTIA